MNWSDLSMSQRSALMSIYLKNGITSLDEMKKHYNSFAEEGNTSPSYPPFNKTPQRTDISDNEKRARGKWHVENAKGNQQSIITKAFNEAKSRGLTTEQAYEYVADVAKQHGWSKEGSIIGERTIQYKASPNITSSDNNISPKYITSEPMSEEEYQRRKALQPIRQSQKTGNPDVIYDSDEKVKRDNPNNPRTPFEPHPITPKEMDVTLKGLKFLQPFDPTGLTGVPDFLNSAASGKDIGINFVGMLPAIGKVKAVENGSRLARFNNSLMDTGEEVLGNLIGRVSPKAGNFINTTTSAVQDITSKPAEEIVKRLMQKRGTQAANRFVTGWNLGATTVNFGRAGEDVYDFFTEDPLVQRVKEGFQFAEGGSIDDPPYKRYYATPQYGFSPETSQTNVYQPIATDVQKDVAQGKPIGTITAKRVIQAKQNEEQPIIRATELPRETQDEINKAIQTQRILQPINTGLNTLEYTPILGDAISFGRAAQDLFNGSTAAGLAGFGMLALPNFIEKPIKTPMRKVVVNAIDDTYKAPLTGKDFDYLYKHFNLNDTYGEVVKPHSSQTKKTFDISDIIKADFDQDKRFMFFEPGRFINYDLSKMSTDEVVKTFGPRAKHLKELYDIAASHNFEGKYAKIGEDAKQKILNGFAVNKKDIDVAYGIEQAKGIYNIPEYRERFIRFGDLGNTFIDDAINRLDNLQIQGIPKEEKIIGQFGVVGGASTQPHPSHPTITIRNTDRSNTIRQMIQHEANHAAHGTAFQPSWMKVHNEKLRPILRSKNDNPTALDKYYNDMDEIVERSKTAVEYASSIRKEGETLESALERLADMAEKDIYNQDIPADVRQMASKFTKESTLKFWKNFVGVLAPAAFVANNYANDFATGGKLDIPPYTQFLNTLPDNLKNSGNEYNMRRYWELNGYPKDFNEGIQLGMFTKQDDGYHANSIAFNPITNSYEFMKDRSHPTYNMELDWYYSDDPEAVEFRKKYKYTPGIGMIPDQYTPRR